MTSPSSSSLSDNTLEIPPSEFWTYVRERQDREEILTLLDGQTTSISHFTVFLALNETIERLEQILARTRATTDRVFDDLATNEFIQRTGPFVHRQHRRFHPFQRPQQTVRNSLATSDSPPSSEYYSPPSSPDPNDLQIPELPGSPWGTMYTANEYGTQNFPINVDSPRVPSLPPPARPDTPIPSRGILRRLPIGPPRMICGRCGQSDHEQGECLRAHNGVTCSRCRRLGHSRVDCRWIYPLACPRCHVPGHVMLNCPATDSDESL
jgi:hypothetical protein